MKKHFAILISLFTLSSSLSADAFFDFYKDSKVVDAPIKGTQVVRVVDKENGAICYLYMPNHIQPDSSTGVTIDDVTDIGSISCIPHQPK
uniref:Uncharacterized protein n=1 Tax=Candidatus Kentrum sp. LFY TaxID=2126342 RepID=A0A450V5T7_9GAMM|nr:MAG: hypothetical protein BECKLFY1418A_GA0070994_111212 [Candidatus Kentron sp. LFY]